MRGGPMPFLSFGRIRGPSPTCQKAMGSQAWMVMTLPNEPKVARSPEVAIAFLSQNGIPVTK